MAVRPINLINLQNVTEIKRLCRNTRAHDLLINTGMAEEIYDEEEEEACFARFVRFRLERVLYTYCRVRVQFT